MLVATVREVLDGLPFVFGAQSFQQAGIEALRTGFHQGSQIPGFSFLGMGMSFVRMSEVSGRLGTQDAVYQM